MRKLVKVILVAFLLLSCFGCSSNKVKKEKMTQDQYNQLVRDWFVEDMSEDYLSVHFGLKNPSVYGIENLEVTLGEAIIEDETESLAQLEERIATLEKIDDSELNSDSQMVIKTLLSYYKLVRATYGLEEDYSFVFTPNSGVNNNLITNFTEFELRNEQDAKDLIVLVKDSGRYFKECIDYTKKQAEDGIMQSKAVIDAVVEQCESFISKVDDNEVITAYNASIEKLHLSNEQQYKDELAEAVKTILIPAYQDVIDMYGDIKLKSEDKRMSDYQYGKQFYQALFSIKSSSTEKVDDVKEVLLLEINRLYNELVSIYQKDKNGYNRWANGKYSYKLTDSYEILTALKQHMVDDFPEIPEVDYTVSFLDPSVTSENVAAYYLLAPVDDLSENVIKANPAYADNDANGYVVTLAHEGYPGHCFQHTYYFSNHTNSEILRTINCIGYTEGWAMYVENYACDYFSPSATIARLDQINTQMSYYLEAYIDILANYEGKSVAEISNVLDKLGFNSAIAQDLVDTVTGDPCLFVPYAYGMYRMVRLQNNAEHEIGKSFDLKEYNTLILDCGDTTFDVLQSVVDNYIASKKK